MSKRITLHGADEDGIAELRELLNRSAASLDSAWTLHTGNDTDLLVIDVDTVYGHMDWLRAHTSGKPVAVITEHTQFSDADLILHKPLTTENLADVLNRAGELIAERIEVVPEEAPVRTRMVLTPVTPRIPVPAAPAVAAPVAVPVPPPAPRAAEAPRERRLCEWLADGALRAAVRLPGADAPELIVDPASKTYYAEGNLRALAPYCARAISPSDWQEVSPAEISRLQDAGKMQPAARLLWLAHAIGSNGHLDGGLDVNAKYKLAKWPQIEREFPKHFRIATVMLKQPATLSEIADQSGASIGDVIDFTNAYNATGFIETEGGAKAAEAAPRDSGRHAILSRLRNPFGGGSSA